MSPMSPYPVILFDVGETLIGPRASFGAIYAEVLASLGHEWPPELLGRSIRETVNTVEQTIPIGTDRYSHYPGGETEYWLRFVRQTLERTVAESGQTIEADEIDKIALQALEGLRDAFRGPEVWHVYPDTRPALEHLREAGVRLGIVSNWDSRLPRILEMLELDGYFDEIGVSALAGAEKPSPRLFRYVLDRMGSPARALHVGDRPDLDLAGARGAGIDGVLIDRDGKLTDHGPTVRSLTELLPT